ncbi:hypothetical protein AM493_20230 [Flavobacterium akiainvivens]|uniref:Tetratricopeptide repeat protein n=1 Tax=Flavobacterium akiainvivens TaxID=1202724 RepID=A0A0M8MC55_9FLAO|nr:hypothetical protein [Flavobacterium akiainvivens]KOS08113.1 hypothetical protein AM493_20230 [Flavobacterium akiainvivens]SFQ72013.1 hypothetical protein SAMN05444144_11754 [Flavobacterium akiainvivens]
MIRVFTTFFLFIFGLANAQTQYETGMKKAFTLWGEGKSTEASALFERIAAAEKTNWLPSYYVALVNTTDAFQTQDKEKISALLAKAEAAADNAEMISPDNSEILVIQALIQTAWIVYDPMTNGMKLSGKVNELYTKAMKLNPNNPRAVFGKAEFEMGGAKYFGGDIKPMCAEVERSIKLFDTFKPESEFHPNWGKDRAAETLKECQTKK